MSRAYRLSVRETLQRVIRASDHVTTRLELLDLLPAEEMGEILALELLRRGFKRRGQTLVRQGKKGVSVAVDPASATITVQADGEENLRLENVRESNVYGEGGRAGRAQSEQTLREHLRKDLEQQADQKAAEMQKVVTDRLEAQIGDLRQELDQVVNRVTAEALKRKASRIGQIREMTEDAESGSLTIVLEV
jgi:hypothetical protein